MIHRVIVIALCVCAGLIASPTQVSATVALVANTCVASANGNNVTTGSLDTTGATVIVIGVGTSAGTYGSPPTDSKSNTWTPLTTASAAAGNSQKLYYVENGTVGTGHTFTYAETAKFPSICVVAFSGTQTSGSFDVQNTGTAESGTTVQPGSVTPSANNSVLVTGVSHGSASVTIDGSFLEGGDVGAGAFNWGCAIAYKIQTTAGAENPTWTEGGTDFGQGQAAAIAVFQDASAGATTPRRLSFLGVGN